MKKIILAVVVAIALISCSNPVGSGETKTVYIHDTIRVKDTIGSGQITTLVSGYLNSQYIEDTLHFNVEGHKINGSLGSSYVVYKDSVINDIYASVDKSVAYIKSVAAGRQINKAAINNLLTAQCSREIANAIRYVSAYSSLITEITTAATNKYNQAVLEVNGI